jgi:integrase
MDFDEFIRKVLRLYQEPLRAKSTRLKMRQALTEFMLASGVDRTDQFTTDAVCLYLERRPRPANTTISMLRCLRTASFYAVAEGWLDRPPQWRRLVPRRTPPARRLHYDHAQVAALLEHLRGAAVDWRTRRLHAAASTVAYTGLRRREALYLHVADLDLGAGLLHVVARRRLKTTGAAAPVPVPGELAEVLAEWLPHAGSPWLFPGVRRLSAWDHAAPGYRPEDHLKAAGAAVGLPGVTWHGLRHTLAKLMVGRWGLSADQTRSMLRHGDVRTTEDYYLHRDDAELLRAIGARISFRPPPAA